MTEKIDRRKHKPRHGTYAPCLVCQKPVYRYPNGRQNKTCSLACRDVMVRAKRVNEAEGTARCAACREWKPIQDFVRGQFGRPHSHCKPCNSAWFAKRRGTPPEKRQPYRPAFKLTEEQKKANKRDYNRRQHVRRRGAGPAPERFAIGRMLCGQDARCAYCRTLLSSGYHIDHKNPVSRGGSNDLTNLHITCPRCNMRKGAMTHEEFLASKKRKVVDWSAP